MQKSGGGALLAGHGLVLAHHDHTVVEGVSLELRADTVTALVGPNGSGKSTVLRSLARLHRPKSGDVVLGAADLRAAARRTHQPPGPALPGGGAGRGPRPLRRPGVAVGVVLHDLDHAAIIADQVVLLSEGRVVAGGDVGSVLTTEHLSQAYPSRTITDQRARSSALRAGVGSPSSGPP